MIKSLKKPIVIIFAVVFFVGGAVLTYTFKSNSHSAKASQQLIAAIWSEDMQTLSNIVELNPQTINTLPSMSPWWWQLISEQPISLYPLQEACIVGNYDIVKLLIDNGADCNLVWKGIEGSKTPLMRAVIYEQETAIDIVELLLESGADKNLRDNSGKTAYDYALQNGNLELAELLRQ